MKTNYIICKEHEKPRFIGLGFSTFCELEDMVLYDTISFDFETTGLQTRKNDVFCCQIGNGINSNYIVVMYNDNYSFYDVIPYLKDKEIIGHNLTFDLGFMYKYNFYPEKTRDTMIASKIIYNGQVDERYVPYRHDLGAVFAREIDLHLDKTDQKNIHLVKLSQKSTIEYSFNDVDRLLELHDALTIKIDSGGFRATYDLHCKYIRALSYMEQCGLPISPGAWKKKMVVDIENTIKWKSIIEEYIYDNIPKYANNQIDMFDTIKRITLSIESPKQMIKVFNALGIETKDKDGKESINEKIISKSKHEFVKLWLDFQTANHRVSTFGENIYNQIENNRIYTTFNPMVDTARLSTRKGNINFLNFPADKITRKCFEANEGNVLIVCDYSGQETVIAADLSRDEAMTKAVNDNADLHCMLARILFPEISQFTDKEIITNHKEKRSASKAPRFN